MLPFVSHRRRADPSKTGSGLYEELLSIDLLKKKFQEEVEFWKRETERLQQKLHEAEVVQRKLINDTFQVLMMELFAKITFFLRIMTPKSLML